MRKFKRYRISTLGNALNLPEIITNSASIFNPDTIEFLLESVGGLSYTPTRSFCKYCVVTRKIVNQRFSEMKKRLSQRLAWLTILLIPIFFLSYQTRFGGKEVIHIAFVEALSGASASDSESILIRPGFSYLIPNRKFYTKEHPTGNFILRGK